MSVLLGLIYKLVHDAYVLIFSLMTRLDNGFNGLLKKYMEWLK